MRRPNRNMKHWILVSTGVMALVLSVIGAAQAKKPFIPSCDNTQMFALPIPLGVSGGNLDDTSAMYCCSGTLGALVQKKGTQYVLSNNHVLAITNKGQAGELVIQPGLVDTNCGTTTFNEVATLSTLQPIDFAGGSNTVDAAIAQVEAGAVQSNGAINCIGSISSAPVDAFIGLKVQKSGRTTGVTSGTVGAVGVTILVTYNTSCGEGSQTAKFVNQVMIKGGGFSRGGDSGSLILTKPASGCPQPVGLLFAGGANQTFANPIQDVLDAFGVAMVGDCNGTVAAPGALPSQAEVNRVKAVKEHHEASLLKTKGVVGVGVGLSEDQATPVIEVYVKKHTPEVEHQLPKQLDGVKVRIVETGEIRAL